jgi:hypothetical protein
MLEELGPAGQVETLLAERVVSLSWRLRRAERLQNAAFAALDEGEPTDLLEARHEEWKQLKASEWEQSISGVIDENALGQVVVEDFAGARVLDRLLMYERRIESSLYRTMAQLRRERETRTAATPKDACVRKVAFRRVRRPQHRRNWVRLAQTECRRSRCGRPRLEVQNHLSASLVARASFP